MQGLYGGSTALFTVNLSAAADTATTVKLTLNAGDTEAGDIGTLEYFDGTNWVGVPADGIVSLAAGTTALQLRVQTNDDSVYEGAESFSVAVTGQTGTTGTATGNATIVDDGTGPGPNPDDDRPSVSMSNAGTLNEGSTALFTVNLSAAADTATTVKLTLNAGDTEAATSVHWDTLMAPTGSVSLPMVLSASQRARPRCNCVSRPMITASMKGQKASASP